tara:strand:- start:198 stop:662 length:465 start_codon:yes stop_codon:yes gene_type:complete
MSNKNIRGLSDIQRNARIEKNTTRNITALLPLQKGNTLDFEHVDEYIELIKQNAKLVMFTVPGERVMDPEFGVGLQKYLFENASPVLLDDIRAEISNQFGKYLPYVEITRLEVVDDPENDNKILVLMQIRVSAIEETATLLFNDKGELSDYISI